MRLPLSEVAQPRLMPVLLLATLSVIIAVAGSIDVRRGRPRPQRNLISAILAPDGLGVQLVGGSRSGALVWGSFEDDIANNGWSYLEIRSNSGHLDEATAYAAGAVEANLTRRLIDAHLHNVHDGYCTNNTAYCDKLERYFSVQLRWMNERASEERFVSPFWNQVFLMLKQLAGLDDAYYNRTLNYTNSYDTVSKLFLVNNEGTLYDLEPAFGRIPDNASLSAIPPCSMLIRLTNRDLLAGHTSWWVYRAMLRIQKKYMLSFRLLPDLGGNVGFPVPGRSIAMSSYPGKLSSMDDFYVISSGLVVTETTNNVFNKSLYDAVHNESVPTSFRAMAANRIASDGRHWTRIFKKHNSGLYNNQWVVIDYKKVNASKDGIKLANETFWMLEQMPTLIRSQDMTSILEKQGYWGSYNVPYFSGIYNVSGYLEKFKEFGDVYSYERCPRARIFQRDYLRVKDPQTMIAMLRYNDFKHDPLSACNCTPGYSPVYTIAARYDLNDPHSKCAEEALDWNLTGAIDVKVANIDSARDLSFDAVCGPTYDQQPVFSWSTSGAAKIPIGHPDRFEFKPVRHRWTL